MSKTQNFRTQHAELAEIVTGIERLLTPDQVAAQAGHIRSMFSTLIGKLNIHLSMEDNSLYPVLNAHADANLRAVAQKFTKEMATIKPAVHDFSRKWSEAAIKGDPAAFIGESKKLFAALADRIKRENNELYALYDKLG